MQCFHPLTAYRCADGSVVFSERSRFDTVATLSIRCGQCVGCRVERSRQWAIRCMHEASLYDRNCFLTLTYDDAHVPEDGSLRYRDFQLFLKRLRQKFRETPIRFYMCGEYGDENNRPHFHACLFNFDFPDKLYFKRAGDSKLYTSRVCDQLWNRGYATIGDVTFESAAYVARYCMKKVTGDKAASHYTEVDVSTGEVIRLEPEFCHMSLKPGIGKPWFDRFYTDVYPGGAVVVDGRLSKSPRRYDEWFKKIDVDDELARVVVERERLAHVQFADNSDERLAVKEKVAQARVSLNKRKV